MELITNRQFGDVETSCLTFAFDLCFVATRLSEIGAIRTFFFGVSPNGPVEEDEVVVVEELYYKRDKV